MQYQICIEQAASALQAAPFEARTRICLARWRYVTVPNHRRDRIVVPQHFDKANEAAVLPVVERALIAALQLDSD